jgi:hypothetical protein
LDAGDAGCVPGNAVPKHSAKLVAGTIRRMADRRAN